jgi:NADH-quinone oxidoreductase subunit M
MRFAIPLAPEAAASLHWLLAGLGVVAALHGALAALAQTNLRVMLAYAGVSHVGLVLLGLASFTEHGVQGALLLTVSLVFATGGGFLAASFLQLRIGSCEVQNLGGVFVSMPRLAVFFLLCGLAGLGLPGTAGFPGEWLVLLATLQTHTGAGIAALAAMVFGGAYFMGLYRKAFFGPATRPAVATADDLLVRERWAAVIVGAMILIFGFWPQPVLDLTRVGVQVWLAAVIK